MSERHAGGSALRERTREKSPPEERADGAERKPVFLRTVYPLNPGIPHYLDFPQGGE